MTVKMKKGDLVADIDGSPESIAHAYSLGFVPINKAETDAALKAGINAGQANPAPQDNAASKDNAATASPAPDSSASDNSDKKNDPKKNKLFG